MKKIVANKKTNPKYLEAAKILTTAFPNPYEFVYFLSELGYYIYHPANEGLFNKPDGEGKDGLHFFCTSLLQEISKPWINNYSLEDIAKAIERVNFSFGSENYTHSIYKLQAIQSIFYLDYGISEQEHFKSFKQLDSLFKVGFLFYEVDLEQEKASQKSAA